MPLAFSRARTTAFAALATAGAVLAVALPTLHGTAHATGSTTRHVATYGSDTGAGTAASPFRSVQKGLTALAPGDTLVVHGGTYAERITSARIQPGTATARTRVVAAPGERPVLQGLLWLTAPSYWDISGLNVTWDPSGKPNEHMVKLTGGTGWTFTDAEVWGARSYAGILVAGQAADWRIARNYVHDTYATNGTNQDHLIYANSGSGGGIIERNVLARSSNGRAVKVGPPSATSGTVSNVVIRYNTMFDNRGPSNVQLAWGTSSVRVYGNIMVAPQTGRSAVTGYQLTGTGNVVSDNLGWQTPRLLDTGLAGLHDGGGNTLADPRFVDPSRGDFRTLNPTAAAYGRFATAGTMAGRTQTAPEPVAAPVCTPQRPRVGPLARAMARQTCAPTG